METLPIYVSLVFLFSVLFTAFFFFKATNNSKVVLFIITAWIIFQSVLGLNGFYTETDAMPPRMLFLLAPPFLAILLLFVTPSGRTMLDNLDAKWLTDLHFVRVPVEIGLFLLFINGSIPEIMTFEGRNFDIIAGLTAPFFAFFYYSKHKISRKALLIWNFVCLGLVINIAYHGILSVPTPFQQFGFEQPNIGLLYFPFMLLPGFIVPAVLFSQIVSIRQLLVTMSKKVNTI